MTNFDLIILGSGPGGYVAAIRASQLGLKVALVERKNLGGVCLNVGCIPTKALLRSAEVYDLVKRSQEFGIKVSNYGIDFPTIIARSRNVANQLSTGVKHLMKKNKITIVQGSGYLNGKSKNNHVVKVVNSNDESQQISAPNVIIATGARPRILKNFEPDKKLIWTYKEALMPESQPKSLAIVGSGAIGVEFASFYNSIGTKVHLLEAQNRILPIEDHEISALALDSFLKKDINISTGVKLLSITKNSDSVVLKYLDSAEQELSLEVDRIIMAVGITANTENLGLENTKAKIANNAIEINKHSETDEPGIYAIGDVAGPPWLAHKASHEGVLCAEYIAGISNHTLDKSKIVGCTYCSPQIASFGLTEEAAKRQNLEIRVGKFPYQANGKAIALGETEGFCKTIIDSKTDALLGAHIIGAEATELISSYVLGNHLEATSEDFLNIINAHPTLSEMSNETFLNAYSKALHI